ncbi:MAG: hypothetical protein KH230_19315 [Enterocloster asparagiformis]|nr:hypothetical protein [Enterocloster asparagiformis]
MGIPPAGRNPRADGEVHPQGGTAADGGYGRNPCTDYGPHPKAEPPQMEATEEIPARITWLTQGGIIADGSH